LPSARSAYDGACRGPDRGSRARATRDAADERAGRCSSGGAPNSLALARLSRRLRLRLLLLVLLVRGEGIDACVRDRPLVARRLILRLLRRALSLRRKDINAQRGGERLLRGRRGLLCLGTR